MTYLEKGDFANAEKALMEVATSVNANREVFYNLGEVKFAKGETDEAVKYYQRAVDMDANWGKPLFKIGLAQAAEGRHRRRDRDHEQGDRRRSELGRSRAGQGADRAAEEGLDQCLADVLRFSASAMS